MNQGDQGSIPSAFACSGPWRTSARGLTYGSAHLSDDDPRGSRLWSTGSGVPAKQRRRRPLDAVGRTSSQLPDRGNRSEGHVAVERTAGRLEACTRGRVLIASGRERRLVHGVWEAGGRGGDRGAGRHRQDPLGTHQPDDVPERRGARYGQRSIWDPINRRQPRLYGRRVRTPPVPRQEARANCSGRRSSGRRTTDRH